MPASLAAPLPVSQHLIRVGVHLLGEFDQYDFTPRVLVERNVFVSFAELLGLLRSGDLLLTEFDDDTAARYTVQVELAMSSLRMVREKAADAMLALAGVSEDPEDTTYTAGLARVVTRVFGLTPPAMPDASHALVDVRSDVDLAGDDDPSNRVPRVAVPAPLWLSFGELLGALTVAGWSGLLPGEQDDDARVWSELRYQLADTTWNDLETAAEKAIALLDGTVVDPGANETVRAIAPAVTRMFGIAR